MKRPLLLRSRLAAVGQELAQLLPALLQEVRTRVAEAGGMDPFDALVERMRALAGQKVRQRATWSACAFLCVGAGEYVRLGLRMWLYVWLYM